RDTFHRVAKHVLLWIEFGLLRQVADLDTVGSPRLADEVVDLARHDLEKRRLASTIETNDANLRARQEGQRDILEHLLSARVGLGELVHVIDILVCGHCAGAFRRKLRDCARSSPSGLATQCTTLPGRIANAGEEIDAEADREDKPAPQKVFEIDGPK